MPRNPITPIRLDPDDVHLLDRLRGHLAAQDVLGRAVTRADVVRVALRSLAAATLPAPEEGPKKKPKKKSETA